MNRTIAMYAILVFLSPTDGAIAAPGSIPPSVSINIDTRNRLAKVLDVLDSMRSAIDRSQLELDYLLNELDYEFDDIVHFVMTEIRFEQYRGLLRGSKGTLLSRAGNALDQSVLLAQLLRDAGFEARIHRGQLDEAWALRLLAHISQRLELLPPFKDTRRFEELIKELEEITGIAMQQLGSLHEQSAKKMPYSVASIVRSYTQMILQTLERSGISLGDSSVGQGLVDETRDYFWVAARSGPSEDWQAFHPAFGDSLRPPVSIDETYTDKIPSQLQHRVRLQAKISRRIGPRIETRDVTGVWELPSANLVGTAITYENGASTLASEHALDPGTADSQVDESTIFFPMLNGAPAPGAQAFDLSGNIIDAATAGSFMAGVVKQVGARFGKATGVLDGLGIEEETSERTPAMELQEHWLEITLIGPGGVEQSFRRTLWEGKENTQAKGRLTQSSTFAFITGDVPPAFVVDHFLEQYVRIKVGLPFFFEATGERYDRSTIEAYSNNMMDQVLFASLAQQGSAFSHEALAYYSEPAIVVRHSNAWLGGESVDGFDIVNNTRRVLRADDAAFLFSADEAVARGVLDTLSEQVVLPPGRGMHTVLESVHTLPSEDYNRFIRVVRQDDELDALGLPVHEQIVLQRDLASGFIALVIPRLDAESHIAWWRINPASGETLGMTSIGWGASPTTERSVSEDAVRKSISCTLTTYQRCTNAFNWLDGISRISAMGTEFFLFPAGTVVSWAYTLQVIHRFWVEAGGDAITRKAAIAKCTAVLKPLLCKT